jgi:DNA-binding transcriptional MerR regulator
VLTIGELTRHAGTTVRAVRHYHAIGLLPEPPRDRSGYRRYGASALVVLLRVRRMRELGLPLDRIAGLLAAPAADLRAGLDALDAELAAQAERIAAQRARFATLRADAGDPELPPPLDAVFARAAAEGVPLRALRQDEELLLLDLALHPGRTSEIAAEYAEAYEEMRARPGTRRAAVPRLERRAAPGPAAAHGVVAGAAARRRGRLTGEEE